MVLKKLKWVSKIREHNVLLMFEGHSVFTNFVNDVF